jgi:hypothetical protein
MAQPSPGSDDLYVTLEEAPDVIMPATDPDPDSDEEHVEFNMGSPEVIQVDSDLEEDPDPEIEVITISDSEDDDLALAAAADPAPAQEFLICAYCHGPYDNMYANDHDLCPQCMIQHFMD